MSTVLGAPVRLSAQFTDSTNTLVDPTTVTLWLNLPDQTTTSLAAVRDSTGVYHYDYTPTQTGTFDFWFAGTGSNAATQPVDVFTVVAASSRALISLADTKAHLNKTATSVNPSANTDDAELLKMITAASDVVNWLCGYSRPTTFTEFTDLNWGALTTPNGVYASVVVNRLPLLTVTSITPQFYGSTLSLTGVVTDQAAGIVYVPIFSIPQLFTGPVTVTYSAGRTIVPVVLQEAALIITQNLWETQRGPAARGPGSFGRPGLAEEALMEVPGMGVMIPARAMELMVRSPYYSAAAVA